MCYKWHGEDCLLPSRRPWVTRLLSAFVHRRYYWRAGPSSGGDGSVCGCYTLRNRLESTSLVTQTVNHLPALQETWVRSLGQEDPLEKGKATPVFLRGDFHGQRNLVGYSPQDHRVRHDWATHTFTSRKEVLLYEWCLGNQGDGWV